MDLVQREQEAIAYKKHIKELKEGLRAIRKECEDDHTIGYHDWIIMKCDELLDKD
mgnify:CR=1 FL=1